jgi:hypothetical protein
MDVSFNDDTIELRDEREEREGGSYLISTVLCDV